MGRVRILAGCGPAHDLCIVRAPRAGRRGRRPLRRGRGRTRGSDGCAGAAPTVSRLAGDRRKDTSPEGGRQERGADSPERPPPTAASRGIGGCHLPRRGRQGGVRIRRGPPPTAASRGIGGCHLPRRGRSLLCFHHRAPRFQHRASRFQHRASRFHLHSSFFPPAVPSSLRQLALTGGGKDIRIPEERFAGKAAGRRFPGEGESI